MSLLPLFAKHPHWQGVQVILQTLEEEGFTAYIAGGCVRDALLGRSPHDFDIATKANPEQIKALFPRAIDVGQAFGVMIIPFTDYQIEVATFRRDGEYQDGRRPNSVTYSNEKEDVLRRDFTINALFYDVKSDRVIDYVGGLNDLDQRLIRTVGDPHQRFMEDKLRMIRAARFTSQLEFALDPYTKTAIKLHAASIVEVSRERISQEFKKIAICRDPIPALKTLKETGLLDVLWPTITFIQQNTEWNQFLRALTLLNPVRTFEVFLALVEIFERMSHQKPDQAVELPFILSRQERRDVQKLCSGYFVLQAQQPDYLLLLNEEIGPLLTEIGMAMADLGYVSKAMIAQKIEYFLSIADERGELPPPLLNGDDLMQMGLPPTNQIGIALRESYFAQLAREFRTKAEAQAWVLSRFTS